jgi:hypothetical protein
MSQFCFYKFRFLSLRRFFFLILPSALLYGVISLSLISCHSSVTKKKIESKTPTDMILGTYGYDLAFLKAHQLDVIELSDRIGKARLLISPSLQGRVMTSSANGESGKSFGWINYKFIQTGKISQQFNPYGGEERFWLGPEGGPYSIYFSEGKEQIFENWKVPSVLDTEPFEVKFKSSQKIEFTKKAVLKNVSGAQFDLKISRTVSLLDPDTLQSLFNCKFPASLKIVAYQSENSITNQGPNTWSKEHGLLSVWMLSMFNPSPSITVFIPYKKGVGTIVNDDYFGKLSSDRLKVEDGMIYFKIDGKLRSKIGLPPEKATGLCGSYDSEQKILTLLWCSLPISSQPYVNSKWGKQDDSYKGDVINSYNDGPVLDGSIMGPFYEVETSSPAACLGPGQSLTHIQRIVHLQGAEADLACVIKSLFDIDLQSVIVKFQK